MIVKLTLDYPPTRPINIDTAAHSASEETFQEWVRKMEDPSSEAEISSIVEEHTKERPAEVIFHAQDTYNRSYRVKFNNGTPDVLVKFAADRRSMLPFDRILNESMTMSYVRVATKLPIPIMLAYGKSKLGPFVITEFVEGEPLSEYLRDLKGKDEVPGVLDSHVDIQNLRLVYRPMAEILSQLYDLDFAEIGGYVGHDRKTSKPLLVPPITRARTEFFRLGNVPEEELSPNARFIDGSHYLSSRAEDILRHFVAQPNDAVLGVDDCRKKYIARVLFRRIASKISTKFAKGPFKLYGDDFGPWNVLVDEVMNVRAVVDWEFTYAAPVEFAHCAPRWLLLTRPEDDADGEVLDNFLSQYEARHRIFIDVLREYEIEREKSGHVFKERLSDHMARSLENGNFWILAAASSGYAFDRIFWKFIYPKYYKDLVPDGDLRHLLYWREVNRMENIVDVKTGRRELKLTTSQVLRS